MSSHHKHDAHTDHSQVSRVQRLRTTLQCMATTAMHVTLTNLLNEMINQGASDLHLSADMGPRMRIEGTLYEIDAAPLDRPTLWTWLESELTEGQIETYERSGDIDFGMQAPSGDRFRVSLFRERGLDTLAVRRLSSEIPTMQELALPTSTQQWTDLEQGLILVAGPTGSGKSTTIAAMVNRINESRPVHIVTIEDPIEYQFPSAESLVRQREIGPDSDSFARAVRAALREDVDVLMVGELRDPETMAAALSVAETGHLVFATIHTNSAEQAIDRLIDAFANEDQPLIRSRLAATLIGVIYQRLLNDRHGSRVAAFEVLAANAAVRNLIREGKTFQIPNTMLTGASYGMQTMSSALAELAESGVVSELEVERFLLSNPL